MPEEKEAAHRLAAYSDAVFAVIVTVMVLELEAPDQPAFSALWPLWPTAVSYNVFEREVLARAGPPWCPSERVAWPGADRSLSLGCSPPPCWLP